MMAKSLMAGFVMVLGLPVASPQEQIAPRPREAEVLTVMPRERNGLIEPDPPYILRGSLRNEGTYETPLGRVPFEVNKRQLDLLRSLDNFKLYGAAEERELNAIRQAIGPEPLMIMPREVKKPTSPK